MLQRCSLPSGTSTLLSPPCPRQYQNPQAGAGALRSRNGGCSQHQEAQIQLLDTAVFLWEGSSSWLQLFFHLVQQRSTFLTSCSQIAPASPMLPPASPSPASPSPTPHSTFPQPCSHSSFSLRENRAVVPISFQQLPRTQRQQHLGQDG